MPWTEFESKIPAIERPQTYAFDRAATRTGIQNNRAAEMTGLSVRRNNQDDFGVQTVVRIPWPPCSILSSVRGCQAGFDPHQMQNPIVATGEHFGHNV
jgi:hypothetical protein